MDQPPCKRHHRQVSLDDAADVIYYWYTRENIRGIPNLHTYLFGYFFTKSQKDRWHINPRGAIRDSLLRVEVDFCSDCMPPNTSFPNDGARYYMLRCTSKVGFWQIQIPMPMLNEARPSAKNELQALLQEICSGEDIDPEDWTFNE